MGRFAKTLLLGEARGVKKGDLRRGGGEGGTFTTLEKGRIPGFDESCTTNTKKDPHRGRGTPKDYLGKIDVAEDVLLKRMSLSE